jgi:hypothetical protein
MLRLISLWRKELRIQNKGCALLFIAIFISFQSSPAFGGLEYNFLPETHLSAAWSEIATERDYYRLAATSSTLENTKNDPPKPEAINIPLDPDMSALNPPEGRWFGKYTYLARDTGYLIVPAAIIIGLLYAAPESVSNWDKEDKSNSLGDLGEKWWDNVSNGPVWDEDDWWLNWIGHPYWGATYYLHSRHYAYTKWESFWYSFFVSNILYEYGVEAFAEKPSIQDLILTPVGGWLVGEFIFLPIEAKIISNGNRLWGSKILGRTARFVMDPIGSIIRPLRRLVGRASGHKSSPDSSKTDFSPIEVYPLVGENTVGMQIRFAIE